MVSKMSIYNTRKEIVNQRKKYKKLKQMPTDDILDVFEHTSIDVLTVLLTTVDSYKAEIILEGLPERQQEFIVDNLRDIKEKKKPFSDDMVREFTEYMMENI